MLTHLSGLSLKLLCLIYTHYANGRKQEYKEGRRGGIFVYRKGGPHKAPAPAIGVKVQRYVTLTAAQSSEKSRAVELATLMTRTRRLAMSVVVQARPQRSAGVPRR